MNLQCNPGVTVHAKIVDAEGKAVTGAKVSAQNVYRNKLDADSIDLLAIGPKEQRSVGVFHADRHLGKIVKVSAADAKNTEFQIQLEPVSILKGRIIGRDGQPIAHAVVEGAFLDVVNASTDDDGRFTLTVIPGRPCNLRGIKGNQFLTEVRDLVIPPGETKDLGDVHVNYP